MSTLLIDKHMCPCPLSLYSNVHMLLPQCVLVPFYFSPLIWRWWRLLVPSCVCITHGLSEQSRPFNIKLVYGISILLPPPLIPQPIIWTFRNNAYFHFNTLFVSLFCSSSLPLYIYIYLCVCVCKGSIYAKNETRTFQLLNRRNRKFDEPSSPLLLAMT